jgi:hypothetical protein
MVGKEVGQHTGGGSTKLSRGNGTLTITVYSGSGSSGVDILIVFLLPRLASQVSEGNEERMRKEYSPQGYIHGPAAGGMSWQKATIPPPI